MPFSYQPIEGGCWCGVKGATGRRFEHETPEDPSPHRSALPGSLPQPATTVLWSQPWAQPTLREGQIGGGKEGPGDHTAALVSAPHLSPVPHWRCSHKVPIGHPQASQGPRKARQHHLPEPGVLGMMPRFTWTALLSSCVPEGSFFPELGEEGSQGPLTVVHPPASSCKPGIRCGTLL